MAPTESKEKIEGLEFWPKKKFQGRSLKIFGPGAASIIPVPDNEILCDYCNDLITEFPVPVYFRSALCPKCWKEVKKEIRAQK